MPEIRKRCLNVSPPSYIAHSLSAEIPRIDFLKDAEERCRDGVGFVDTKWQITMHLLKVFISRLTDGVERCRSQRQPLSIFISVIRKPISPTPPAPRLARTLALSLSKLAPFVGLRISERTPQFTWACLVIGGVCQAHTRFPAGISTLEKSARMSYICANCPKIFAVGLQLHGITFSEWK